ncbi:Hypothetical Protein MfeM64YM_0777 [Mycoplasmopsis fermentans M64]|uniref:Uncharacterized protein n=1 Tax=Mycoplasmopsis fermentans (strain M64) TaxID=943945 RepID=A0AB32XCD1_MYCFM|nr:Hypothetical Protein MfeM64YM_0777 [Mycoplasmopsis fermentans M64]
MNWSLKFMLLKMMVVAKYSEPKFTNFKNFSELIYKK